MPDAELAVSKTSLQTRLASPSFSAFMIFRSSGSIALYPQTAMLFHNVICKLFQTIVMSLVIKTTPFTIITTVLICL